MSERTVMDLVGPSDIAERMGVSRDAVDKWRRRYPDFPEPVAVMRRGAVWEWTAVEAWLEETGRDLPEPSEP